MTTRDQAAAIQCRLAAASRDDLRVLHTFFSAPRLRAHFTEMLAQIDREIAARDKR